MDKEQNLNNPAARLLAIHKSINTYEGNTKQKDVWPKVFNTDDESKIIEYAGKAMSLA